MTHNLLAVSNLWVQEGLFSEGINEDHYHSASNQDEVQGGDDNGQVEAFGLRDLELTE